MGIKIKMSVLQGCGEKDYERVAMRQERKVKGLNEELLVRGEERKFVNV